MYEHQSGAAGRQGKSFSGFRGADELVRLSNPFFLVKKHFKTSSLIFASEIHLSAILLPEITLKKDEHNL